MDIITVMLGVILIVAVLLLMTWRIRNYQEEKLGELPDEKSEETALRRRPGLARMERHAVLRWLALIPLMGLALFLLAILIRWMWIHHHL